MLKRQRPTTPPPSSLSDDPPLLLPDGLPYALGPSHPRFKRQRTHGWPQPVASESDGEEDWIEDPHDVLGSQLPPSTTVNQYKDANNLLHELHVLNQHRLLFAHSPRDQHRPTVPLLTTHDHDPPTGQDTAHHHPASLRSTVDEPSGQNFGSIKVLVEEVQCVRHRYADTNKFLGSLFLSRRREVEGLVSSGYTGPCTTS